MDIARGAAAAALVAALALGAAAEKMVIPEGTVVKVILDTPLSTKDNKSGDPFTLHLADDEKTGGFPTGTKFHGKLVAVRPKTEKKAGSADVSITRAELPGGHMIEIVALPSNEDGKTKETVTGTSIKEKRKKKGSVIGGAGGLLLGPIGSIGGLVARKTLPEKPDDISAKVGRKGYIKIMQPVTLK